MDTSPRLSIWTGLHGRKGNSVFYRPSGSNPPSDNSELSSVISTPLRGRLGNSVDGPLDIISTSSGGELWSGYCLDRVPFEGVYSVIYNLVADSKFLAPVWDCFCDPINGGSGNKVAVSCLNYPACPAAVTRLVVSASINPINGVFLARGKAHIRDEVIQRVPPSFAHGNSLSAIILVPGLIRVIAASNHVVSACFSFLKKVINGGVLGHLQSI